MNASIEFVKQNFSKEGELRYLPPREVALSMSNAGQLRLTLEGHCSFRSVRLVRCFPVSQPGGLIAVRCNLGDQNAEIGVIRELEELRPAEQRTARAHLDGCCLLPNIVEVSELKRDFGYLYWKAETDRGEREFASRDSQEGVTKLVDGGAVVTDTDDCRYRIPEPCRLGRATRSLLARYLFM
jgi:Domain of unknown function (DUF1854)